MECRALDVVVHYLVFAHGSVAAEARNQVYVAIPLVFGHPPLALGVVDLKAFVPEAFFHLFDMGLKRARLGPVPRHHVPKARNALLAQVGV